MVIYKESILKKIWNQIKIIFQKNNKSWIFKNGTFYSPV
jgi:hypothetical protein